MGPGPIILPCCMPGGPCAYAVVFNNGLDSQLCGCITCCSAERDVLNAGQANGLYGSSECDVLHARQAKGWLPPQQLLVRLTVSATGSTGSPAGWPGMLVHKQRGCYCGADLLPAWRSAALLRRRSLHTHAVRLRHLALTNGQDL